MRRAKTPSKLENNLAARSRTFAYFSNATARFLVDGLRNVSTAPRSYDALPREMTMIDRLKIFLSRRVQTLPQTSSTERFLADAKGATAVEFALIIVPFLGLLAAIFETGSVYFKSTQLQAVTEQAGRNILVSSAANGMTYQQFVNNYVCTWQNSGTVAPGTLTKNFDCSKVMVDIRFSGTGAWNGLDVNNDFYNNPNSQSAAITMPTTGNVAVLRIAYPLPVIANILTDFGAVSHAGQVNYNGSYTHMLFGVYAVRVE